MVSVGIEAGRGKILLNRVPFITQKSLSVSEWLHLYRYVPSSVITTIGGEGVSIKSNVYHIEIQVT